MTIKKIDKDFWGLLIMSIIITLVALITPDNSALVYLAGFVMGLATMERILK